MPVYMLPSADTTPSLQQQQQQQVQPEVLQQPQQQLKTFRRQRKAAARSQVQVPGLPSVRLPHLAAGAAADSLWARILVAAIGAAAAAGMVFGLLGGSRKEQQGAAEGTAARWVCWLRGYAVLCCDVLCCAGLSVR
jgi:hypothetical protein